MRPNFFLASGPVEPESEDEAQDASTEKKLELPEPDIESELPGRFICSLDERIYTYPFTDGFAVPPFTEERTPVLVTPPKASPSPSSKSSVKPVFVDQAPTLVGGSMLAELLDEQTPAVEYTEEELRERASAIPVVASVEEDPKSSEIESNIQPTSSTADSYFDISGSTSNDEEKPLPKTEEETRQESVEEKIGQGALGAAGAALAGMALSPSSSEDVDQHLDEDTIRKEIARADAEVSDSEATVDETAWEGGHDLSRSPPQFASMTDSPPRDPPSLTVVNGLPALPIIPAATSNWVLEGVLDRIEKHHQSRLATGEGLEVSLCLFLSLLRTYR